MAHKSRIGTPTIAKLKDGRIHLTYRPEHAVDLDTGAVIAVEAHAADQCDSTTAPGAAPAGAAQTGRSSAKRAGSMRKLLWLCGRSQLVTRPNSSA